MTRKLVQEQVDQSEEVGRVVRALETQFDAFVGGTDRGSLLADQAAMPSAEEIGAQVERFLADLGDDGSAGDRPGRRKLNTAGPDDLDLMSPRTVTLYRVLAYATGVVLLVFTAEIVLKYVFHVEGFEFIAIVHGWIYLFYFLVSAYLAIALCGGVGGGPCRCPRFGTIPFASSWRSARWSTRSGAEHPELVSPG